MPKDKGQLMVVDDDVHIQRMIRRILEMEGYRVSVAGSADEALGMITERMPDLILLDIMLPGMDGCTLCQRLREFSPVPVIMVTARSADEEKVTGLDAGADDYLTKPFSAGELAARVRAVLRRRETVDVPGPVFKKDGLIIDLAAHHVTRHGRTLKLTATEYRILSHLACHAGRVITPDSLLQNVWDETYRGEYHLLQVVINRLRKKLGENARSPEFIITMHGIGYLMPK